MALEAPLASSEIRVFYSYAPADEALVEELEKHLAALHLTGAISDWHAGRAGVGSEWEKEAAAELDAADVILMLVSADGLVSADMTRALARHEAGEARVIPILLRACDWRGIELAKLRP